MSPCLLLLWSLRLILLLPPPRSPLRIITQLIFHRTHLFRNYQVSSPSGFGIFLGKKKTLHHILTSHFRGYLGKQNQSDSLFYFKGWKRIKISATAVEKINDCMWKSATLNLQWKTVSYLTYSKYLNRFTQNPLKVRGLFQNKETLQTEKNMTTSFKK